MWDVIRLKRKSVVASSFEEFAQQVSCFYGCFDPKIKKLKKEKKLQLTILETGHDDITCPLHKVNKLSKTELINSIVLSGLT